MKVKQLIGKGLGTLLIMFLALCVGVTSCKEEDDTTEN